MNTTEKKQFWRQVWIKNILLLVIAFSAYPQIQKAFQSITDQSTLETILLFVGLIIVVPLFANFEFSYSQTHTKSKLQNLLGHAIAFLIMLAVFLMLAMIDVLFVTLVGEVYLFRVVLSLLFLGILLYDFWDASRLVHQ